MQATIKNVTHSMLARAVPVYMTATAKAYRMQDTNVIVPCQEKAYTASPSILPSCFHHLKTTHFLRSTQSKTVATN